MWIERVQWASAQFENLDGRLRPCSGPQAVFACLLNLLYLHSAKLCMERNRHGGHFMKLVITNNLSFTDYYHGNSQ